MGQTRIVSPVNGIVSKRDVNPGQSATMMKNELLTLVSSDTL